MRNYTCSPGDLWINLKQIATEFISLPNELRLAVY